MAQAISLKEAIARRLQEQQQQQQQQQQQPITKPVVLPMSSALPLDNRPVPPSAAASALHRSGGSVGSRRVSIPDDMTDQYFSMELLRDPVFAADGFTYV